MPEYQELHDALRVIQAECKRAGGCQNCALGTAKGSCCIDDNIPRQWAIKNPMADSVFRFLDTEAAP